LDHRNSSGGMTVTIVDNDADQ